MDPMSSAVAGQPSSRMAPHAVRASDADRERAIDLLRGHTAVGRLTAEELEERIDEAYAARSVGEVQRTLRELPDEPAAPQRAALRPPAPAPAHRLPGAHDHGELVAYALVNAMLIAIWAATGAAYFWPIWPLLGWGIPLAVSRLAPGARCSGSSRSASSITAGSSRASTSS